MLNAAFWNPHLLAREVATADRLTGGRVELVHGPFMDALGPVIEHV